MAWRKAKKLLPSSCAVVPCTGTQRFFFVTPLKIHPLSTQTLLLKCSHSGISQKKQNEERLEAVPLLNVEE